MTGAGKGDARTQEDRSRDLKVIGYHYQVRRTTDMKKRALAYATAVAVTTTGALVLSPTPAFAVYDTIELPDGAGYGHIDGTYVSACDTKEDGRGVVTEYIDRDGESGNVSDGTGSDSGCGWWRTGSDITSYRVGLQQPGSSSIAYWTDWKDFA